MNDRIIIVIAVSLSFLINSVMFTWEATRREDNRSEMAKRYDTCVRYATAEFVNKCDEFKNRINN